MKRETEILGTFVHGVLAAFHALGLLFNWRRRNHVDVVMHAAGLLLVVYDTRATIGHYRAAKSAE